MGSISMRAPAACMICRVASMISGPMPSPYAMVMGVFSTMRTSRPPLFSSHVFVYFVLEYPLDLMDTLVAFHLSQLVLLLVVVEHLAGFIEEDDQPSSHGFSCIIRALVELTSIQIAHPRHFRWAKFGIVHMLIRVTE